MKISKNEGIAMAVTAVIGFLGWRLYKTNQKLNDKQAEYNTDLEQVKTDITEEIRKGVHDDIISEAITKAANEKVDGILKSTQNHAVQLATNDIHRVAKDAVTETWNKLKDDVVSDLMKQVGEIDVTEIRTEAIEKARDKAVGDASTAVDKVVDDIRDKFDKRANEAIKNAEKKFNKRLDSNLDYLKNRYQDKIWDSMWR